MSNHLFSSFILSIMYLCVSVAVSVWDFLLWLSYKLSLAIDSTLFSISFSVSLSRSQYNVQVVQVDTCVLWMKNDNLKSASHRFDRCKHHLSNLMFFFSLCVVYLVRDKKTVTWIAHFCCCCWYWCFSLPLSSFSTIHHWDRHQLAFLDWFFSHNKNKQFIFERRRW